MADKAIWAPWRSKFILGKKESGCVFCNLQKGKKPAYTNLIIHRSSRSFVVMNKYPYNAGHLLIVPNRHIGVLERLSDAESLDLMKLTQTAVAVMKKKLKPNAFNIGMNLGRTAGAGMPGHLHMHIVPRWTGDSNFMPIIGGTRVHSVPMKKIYDLLVSGFKSL